MLADAAHDFVLLSLLGSLLVIGLLAACWGLGWWLLNRKGSLSPFSNRPLVLGSYITYKASCEIDRFYEALQKEHPENTRPDLTKATVCPKTLRIFADSLGSRQIASVRRNGLPSHFDSSWLPLEALPEPQQRQLLAKHRDHQSFERPLWVHPRSQAIAGWQRVPNTELQVFLHFHPK